MEHNRALTILAAAAAGRYGIPAMCCYNTEGMLATVRAAEAKRSPAMILLFPWALEYGGPALVAFAARIARDASVPITVHLDHAQSPEIVRQAADLPAPHGFDSIMIDMSHYERAENLRLTAELAAYCHERGIATEAEPGRIEGGEDGVADTAELEAVLTTPEEAGLFADTGIDWLAPAFGNVHGSYGARGPVLDYQRLESIHQSLKDRGVSLVLHGSSSFGPEEFAMCIKNGVTKINVNGRMNAEYKAVQAEMAELERSGRGKATITAIMEEGTRRMQRSVEELIDQLGSAGKA